MTARLMIVVFACLVALPAKGEFALGAKAGTLGLGLEASYQITEKWGIRGGFNQFDFDFDDDVDGVTYQGDLALDSIALMADFRPNAGGFRLTGGGLINDNAVSAVADPVPFYDIGDNTYTLEEVGVLSAKADFDSLAPYLGLGYEFGMQSRFRVSFDLGVLFQGDPSVGISSTGGTLSDSPELREDLDAEEDSFRNDLDGLELYPVVSVGFSYAF